jgi:hypothetical protein
VRPAGAAEAIRAAMDNEDREAAETRWFDAVSAAGGPRAAASARAGRRLSDRREVEIQAPPGRCFEVISSMGGRNGWPAFGWLWRIRGAIDLLLGGVGMRRGRPEGRPLRTGDALDFWRVETCEPDVRLKLSAEMKVPGRAWLEFVVAPSARGALVRQTAEFDPVGLAGIFYWYSLAPIHAVVFRGMLKAIARRAEAPVG